MKKYSVVVMVLSLLLLNACGIKNVEEHSVQSISDTEALSVVLKDIQRQEEDVVVKRIKKEFYDGKYVYEVELYDDSFEYDYEINEVGKILKSEKEAIKTVQDSKTKTQEGISEKEALTLVLEHANLTEQEITLVKIEKDYDDGAYTYEIDFYTNDNEYEYEVSLDGSIVKSEVEKLI